MKKRILAILAALMLSALSMFYPYAEVKAAGLPELIYTSLPLTWPLVTKIFQALGVGTAEYFNSMPLGDREDLVLGVHDYLTPVVTGIFELLGVKSSNDNLDDYIPGVIDDGIMRVPKAVLDAASRFARDHDMLGGDSQQIVVSDAVLFPNVGESIVLNSNNNNAVAYAESVCNASPGDGHYSGSQKALAYVKTNLASGFYVEISFTNWSYNYTTRLKFKSAVSIENANYTGNSINLNSPYVRYSLSDLTCTEIVFNDKTGEETVQQSNFNQYGLQQSINGNIVSSLGIGVEGGTVPVGEKGQTTEQDGAWDLPYADGSAKNIDNVGDTYPLSIPNSVGDALIKWAEHAGDIDIALPDVIDPELTKPVEGDQTIAQEGTVSDPPAIDPDSPLLPNIPALTVPNFIKERFPFCIPFDLVRLVERFNGNGTAAPVFDMERPFFGHTLHIHIDFSMFDDLARIVRVGVLALAAIGIMKLTVEVIKW